MSMPWMKLWIEDLDRDCNALSLRARGAWLWIIFDLRKHGGSRLLSIHQWAQVVRCSEAEFVEALDEIIEQEVCDSSVTKTSRSDASWKKNDAQILITCRRIARESRAKDLHNLRQKHYKERHQDDAQNDASVTRQKQKQKQITEAEAGEGESSSSGRRVDDASEKIMVPPAPSPPPVFEITEKLKAWTQKIGLEVDLEAELHKFQLYCQANGKCYANWQAAFENWLLKAPSFNRANGSRSPPRESIAEHNRRAAAEAEKIMAARRSAQ